MTEKFKNFPFDKRYESTCSGSSKNSKQDKLKEIYTETHCNQTVKNLKDKERILKAAKEK